MADEEERKQQRVTTTVSQRLPGGGLVELIYQFDTRRTAFAIFRGGEVSVASSLDTDTSERLVPVPATNNLIKHGSLLLPDKPERFGSTGELIEPIQAYLFRYVDLSERFQRIASRNSTAAGFGIVLTNKGRK